MGSARPRVCHLRNTYFSMSVYIIHMCSTRVHMLVYQHSGILLVHRCRQELAHQAHMVQLQEETVGSLLHEVSSH